LYGHIKPTIDKFKSKLPRDDIKRLSKDITKKLVESDYKHNRVTDPYKMERTYAHAAKKHVAEYLNKAVKRHREHEKKKKEREAQKRAAETRKDNIRAASGSTTPPLEDAKVEEDDEEVQVSDDEVPDAEEEQNLAKRKRDSETPATPAESEEGASKKVKIETPPPPPPPPPAYNDGDDRGATPTDEVPQQEPSPAETNGSDHKGFAKVTMVNGHRTPMQLATPSTNSSGGHAGGH
jgi:histone-lysine N-methyltransferase SETD2